MKIAGIDYSLTSPSVCIFDGDEWSWENCTFHYLVMKEKNVVQSKTFKGSIYPKYDGDVQRYDNLGKWAANIISKAGVNRVFLEGYAFGATGRVFQIAENTGILKHHLWKTGRKYDVFPPTTVKKFATQKGNANKELMYEWFVKETGIDIRHELAISSKNQWNPLSDIVDAYYIAKMGYEKENGRL